MTVKFTAVAKILNIWNIQILNELVMQSIFDKYWLNVNIYAYLQLLPSGIA